MVVGNCTSVGRGGTVPYCVANSFCSGINQKIVNMIFKYKIKLDVEVEFDVPLLGADTTRGRRKQTDLIAKATLAEITKLGTTSYIVIDREIDEDNLKGKIKSEISLRSAAMLKFDEENK